MHNEQAIPLALVGHPTDHAHFIHGGTDEIHSGASGTGPADGPDLLAAGTDIHAALAGHYQQLIESRTPTISPHLVMLVGPVRLAPFPIVDKLPS